MRKFFYVITLIFSAIVTLVSVSNCSSWSRKITNDDLQTTEILQNLNVVELGISADSLYKIAVINFNNEENVRIIDSLLSANYKNSDAKSKVKSMLDDIKEWKSYKERITQESEINRRRTIIEDCLKKKNDEFTNKISYLNKHFEHYVNRNLISFYIVQTEDDFLELRVRISYYGDKPLYIKRAFISFNGEGAEIDFNDMDEIKSDSDIDGYWEWIDTSLLLRELDFIKHAECDKIKLRLYGKYTQTRKLSEKEIKAFKDIMRGWKALQEEKNYQRIKKEGI